MDVHVRRAITDGLRLRGVDVLTAQEDGAGRWKDPDLLDRATVLGRALFSQDEDLLIEAARRQHEGIPFGGVLYLHPLEGSVRQCLDDLELIAQLAEPEEYLNRVEYLPL